MSDHGPARLDAVTPGRRDKGILSSFSSLLTAQVIGAGLGLLFWITVARLVSAHEVGVAAASISTQTLLGSATTLGLGTLFIAELPLLDAAGRRRLLLRGLLACTLVSFLLGGLLVLASPLIGGNLHEALVDPWGAAVFVVGIAAAAACIVIDQSGLGLKRARLQVGRNVLASGLRFPLAAALLLAGERDSTVLQLSWVAPLVLSLAVSWWRLRLRRVPAARVGVRDDVVAYAMPALRNHVLNLALAAASQLMPVVAGLTLLAVDNAAFAIAWLVASFVFLPPYLLATALFAHGANADTVAFRETVRATMPAALLLSLVLCLGAWGLGRPVMGVFGGHYADNSALLLALLVPAGLWMVVKDHLVALWRTQRRFRTGTVLTSIAVVLEVVGAAVGGALADGPGLCLGWLGATAVEVAVFAPWLREAFGGLRWHWPLSRRGVRRLRDAGHDLVPDSPAPAGPR